MFSIWRLFLFIKIWYSFFMTEKAEEHKHRKEERETEHSHHHSYSNIKIATFLNISFTIIEFIGGAITNSLAILTDALHDFGDSLVLISSWRIEKLSLRKPDWQRTFGYRRMSLLAAFLNAVVLLGGSVVIFFQVIGRLFNPQPVEAVGMIWIAVIGIAANTIGSLRLKKGKSTNEKVLSWHLMEDVLGWIGILVAAVVIHFTGLFILDPIITIGFTAFVLWGVWRNSKELFNIFLEGAPSEQPATSIVQEIEGIEYIKYVYDIHLWSLDGSHHLASIKAIVSQEGIKNLDSLTSKIKDILSKYHITHSTIELERSVSKKEQEQEFLFKK